MSGTPDNPAQRAAYWPLPIARAVPAAVLGVAITFSADHSASLGLVAFGAFAIVSGIAITVLGWMRLAASGVRPYLVAQGVLSVLFGLAALLLRDGGVPSLFLVLTVWAVLTGALELYSGIRTRRRHVASLDWLTVGGMTVIAAIVFVLIPPGFSQEFTGPDGIPRVLDAAVVAVGLLGAYGAIIAVYLLIAGLSAKWGPQAPVAADTADPDSGSQDAPDAGTTDTGTTDAVKGERT